MSSAPEGVFQSTTNPAAAAPAAARLAGRVDSAEGRAEADRNMAEASGTNRQVYTSQHIKNLAFSVFEELRRQRQLCDVVIHIGSSQFSAHRVILAAASPYFRSMFTGRQTSWQFCRPLFFIYLSPSLPVSPSLLLLKQQENSQSPVKKTSHSGKSMKQRWSSSSNSSTSAPSK